MSLPLLTAVSHRWESALAGALGRSEQVHVVRRCADLAELLGSAAAGVGRVAVVSADLRGLDRSALGDLADCGLLVLGVHPPGDEAGERTLRRWGVTVTLPADADDAQIEEALRRLISGDLIPGEPPARATPTHGTPRPPERSAQTSGDAAGPDEVSAGQTPEPDPDDADLDDEGDDEPAAAAATGQVVVVWGPVGAPGRTTVAVNLAAELAADSTPVVLVDADTYGASVAQLLAVLDEAPGVVAATRAADQGRLDGDRLVALTPEVAPGLRVLTGLPRADRWPELRDHAFADVLQACTELARWTVVDVGFCLEQDEELSFDTTAPRRNGATLTALDAADHVVVVGCADPVGMQRLVRGLDLLGEVCQAPRTVVVTRLRAGAVGSDPARRVTEALHRFAAVDDPLLVPEDRAGIDSAVLAGRSLREHRPSSPARAAIAELAVRIGGVAAAAPPARRRWWRGRR